MKPFFVHLEEGMLYRNGVPIDEQELEQYEGPSEEELIAARERRKTKKIVDQLRRAALPGRNVQSGCSKHRCAGKGWRGR